MSNLVTQNQSFLGTGWSFPPEFSDSTEGIRMSSDAQDISESIYILLTTTPGERLMNPEYGCDLQSQVFKNIDATTKAMIEDMITMAILRHEPRVDIISVDLDDSQQMEGRLNVHLTYEIKGVNSRKNMVFPFYLVEGTDL